MPKRDSPTAHGYIKAVIKLKYSVGISRILSAFVREYVQYLYQILCASGTTLANNSALLFFLAKRNSTLSSKVDVTSSLLLEIEEFVTKYTDDNILRNRIIV